MKIYKEIEESYEWFLYFTTELWAGAEDRWKDMTDEEKDELCKYMESHFESDEMLSKTDINDFVWFEWEEIQKELKNEQ